MYEVRSRKFSYNGTTMYDLLKTIDDPAHLRRLDRRQLQPLADELRAFVLESVSQTGGHLSSNLGVIELTIALHYVFDTPRDRIVWDVGHQTYAHKILTGRRARFPPPQRERIRPFRHREFVDVDLRRARHGGGGEARRPPAARRRGDR